MAGAAQVEAPEGADRADDAQRYRGVITTDRVIITGRWARPVAAAEISKMEPRLTLIELRVALVERIERAIFSDPF